MLKTTNTFDLLDYLATAGNGFSERLPSLESISQEYGISISVLREQLQVARALGLVEVRPRTGIRRLPYSFAPAVRETLFYAMALYRDAFEQFADVRRHLELVYWFEAVEKLDSNDMAKLHDLVNRAQEMLKGDPIRVPHAEHRELHITIFRHLDNPFVLGMLEAYWDAYEEVGLSRYSGLSYLQKVWDMHALIVDAIEEKKFEDGHRVLNEHFELIDKRPE